MRHKIPTRQFESGPGWFNQEMEEYALMQQIGPGCRFVRKSKKRRRTT